MIRVDRNSQPVPAILAGEDARAAYREAKRHFGADEPAVRQQVFQFTELYKRFEVREALAALFADKCAFCESPVDPAAASPITHHFRPTQEAVDADGGVSRPHYWWLAYEWDNLYLSCQRCATSAGAQFPVLGNRAEPGTRERELSLEKRLLVDPCHDDPNEHLEFRPDGSVAARTPSGEHTIAVYSLNRRALVEARKRAIDAARGATADVLRDRSRPYAGAIAQILASAPPAAYEPLSFLRRVSERCRGALDTLLDRLRRATDIAPPLQAGIVERLEIRNFRGIEKLELDLAQPDDEAPWSMILGENGHGKTSVLQALALVLMGADARAALRLDPVALVRDGADSAEIVAYMRGSLEPRTLRIRRASPGFEATGDDSSSTLAAYGAARIPSTRQRSAPPISASRPRVENLFDPAVPLVAAQDWLVARDAEQFDFAARALRRLLVDDPDHTAVKRESGRVELETGDGPKDVRMLSDGYRSMIALATDVMSFFMSRYGSMDAAQGVVLVDELGAHLHPRWQMRVVEAFREAFPRLQVIATTHDPLCLRGLRSRREVIVLRRTAEQRIYALPPEEVPAIEGLRVDELLTSEAFGLNSTIDPRVESLFDRYYALLASHDRGPKASEDIATLRKQLAEYRQLGSTPRERMALEAADEYLARAGNVAESSAREELSEKTRDRLRAIWAGTTER